MTHRSINFSHIAHEPTLDVIQGTRDNLTNKEIEGVSTSLTSGVEKCVWHHDDVFSYVVNGNIIPNIVSDSANDTASGTGARTVKITGLLHQLVSGQNTFTRTSVTATLNGTTNVSGFGNFYRVEKLEVLTAGSSGLNQGNIKVFSQGTTNVVASMSAGDNVSNQLILSPADNEDALVERIHVSGYFQTPVELKINVYEQSTGLQKTIYKFFCSSNSNNFTFNIRKKLVSGDTLWASLKPITAVTGLHNSISVLCEATLKNKNSVVPTF